MSSVSHPVRDVSSRSAEPADDTIAVMATNPRNSEPLVFPVGHYLGPFYPGENAPLKHHIVRVGVNYKLPWSVLDSFFKR